MTINDSIIKADSHGVLSRRRELLQQLVLLAKEQLAVIESSDTAQLLSLLAKKQPLVEALIATQQEAEAICVSVAGQSGNASASKVASLAKECDELGKKLLKLEDISEQKASSKRDSLAKQIGGFTNFDSRSSGFDEAESQIHLATFDESS